MRSLHRGVIAAIALLLVTSSLLAQQEQPLAKAGHDDVPGQKIKDSKASPQKVVVVTGARFSYALIEKWIDDYTKENPGIQIIIDSRGSNDPQKYDILAEVYEQDDEVKKNREYVYIARYAVVPVATANSAFSNFYLDKGLNKDILNQIFFHDIFIDQEKVKPIKEPFTTYTRMQKAGVPTVFAKYFGHEQRDIKGSAIAGSDAHLIKALLRDSVGVSYLPAPLAYDFTKNAPVEGLVVLPVDLNGNGKISDDEKIFGSPEKLIQRIESTDQSDVKNVPIGYLHLSVDRTTANQDAVDFLKWVSVNGRGDLHQYGFLNPEGKGSTNDKFNEFASKRAGQ